MPDYCGNDTIIIILGSYIALFLSSAQSALHSITPAGIASLGNLTYCCHTRRRSQYPLKLGTHISPGWREAQTRLTSCPRMLSHMKQLASLGIKPTTLGSNTLPTEPHETQAFNDDICSRYQFICQNIFTVQCYLSQRISDIHNT